MRSHFFTAFAVLLFSTRLALGDLVISTGFEPTDTPAYPGAVANLPSTTTLPVFDVNIQGIRELRLADSPFGTGQYLALGSNNMRVRSFGTTPLTTVAFDLFEPTGFNGRIRFGFGNADLNANATTGAYTGWVLDNGAVTLSDQTALVSGSLPTLALDTVYRAHFLMNRSGAAETLNYGAGSITLQNNQTAMLFYNYSTGAFLEGGVYSHTLSVTNPNNFFFRTFNADTGGLIYIDNYARHNTLTAIPEPTSAMALLATSFGMLMVRRRK